METEQFLTAITDLFQAFAPEIDEESADVLLGNRPLDFRSAYRLTTRVLDLAARAGFPCVAGRGASECFCPECAAELLIATSPYSHG